MKLIAHIPSNVEMRVVTDFLRSIGLEPRYKNGCLIAEGSAPQARVVFQSITRKPQ